MTDNEQPSCLAQGIAAALEQKRPWMLASLARAFKVTEKDVAGILPEGMCAFTSGEHFEEVWTALGAWERATLIVEHGMCLRSDAASRRENQIADITISWGRTWSAVISVPIP